MKTRKIVNEMSALRAYHYVPVFDIVHTVQARDVAHAIEKLAALHGVTANPAQIMSHPEYVTARDAALEPMGKAPWQKALNRAERKNKYPLV